jgi:hypothetical protein
MSSQNSPILKLDVGLRRAEARAAGLVLAVGACGVVLLAPVSLTYAFASAGCLVAIAFGLWRAGWIGSRHRIVGLQWLSDGTWLLAHSSETPFPGTLSGGTRLGRDGLWLQWTTGRGRRRSILLAPGDLPPSQLRKLAVRLRIEAVERALPEARRR